MTSVRIMAAALAASLVGGAAGATPVAAAAGDLRVDVLSVGQGDALLFQGPCGETGLLDAGEGSVDEVRAALQAAGVAELAWVAASHYDADHIGDVVDVADVVRVNRVYDRGGDIAAKDTATYRAYHDWAVATGGRVALDIGDTFSLCGSEVSFSVASAGTDGTAAGELPVAEENDRGLCLLVDYAEFEMASCGDLNGVAAGSRSDVESAVAAALGDVEVAKVNHHGSAYSSNAVFVDALHAEVAVVSVGANSYGHPAPAALSRWDSHGDVYQTGLPSGGELDGTVTIVTDGSTGFRVTTSASGQSVAYGLDNAGPLSGGGRAEPAPPAAARPVPPAPVRPLGLTRVAGSDRWATAARVSASSFPGGANDVFIVTGTNWPDALSAGAAAAAVNGPVLPVTARSVPAVVLSELARLDPVRAWVIGGRGAVSDAVLSALEGRGIEVTRISGPDRYATAAAVQAQFFPDPAGAYYASGYTYADALAGGAAAAHRGWPLLLTAPGALPASTPVVGSDRVVLGGTGAVSDGVRRQLGARRVSGADRYATAAAIARDAWTSSRVVYLAVGTNYPDALTGTVAAHRDSAPLLLTPPSCAPKATRDAAAALGSRARVALGGTGVISNAAASLSACAAPAPAPAPAPRPAPTPRPTTTPVVPARPADVDCGDFATQAQAQAWFNRYYPSYGDIARLDADNDRRACESLP